MGEVRINTPAEARQIRTRGRRQGTPRFERDAEGNATGVVVELPDQAAEAARRRIEQLRRGPN